MTTVSSRRCSCKFATVSSVGIKIGRTWLVQKKSLDEYVDLFINFKLKVREAEDLGLDTVTAFQTELAGYREQLAKPYFIDESVVDRLVKEAYDRSRLDIRASHIFVRLKQDALPSDTLAAWQKISKIRERVVNGENFEELAAEFSEDPSVPAANHFEKMRREFS